MIAGIVTDKDGWPLDSGGKRLSPSAYAPSKDVMDLFARVQDDYTVAYNLQHRNFQEFDDVSLLDRARKDQQTFSAYVGAEFVPVQKKWRWKGRKNTARNRIIGILAHLLAAMLFPYVRAVNDQDEEEKDAARVMQILIEDHLRKAGYEMKFLYMAMSALVNPAVFVNVEYVEAIQKIKQRKEDGSVEILEVVDQLLSGLNLNIIPIDELLLADFYTFELQRQPYLCRVRRIPWDESRKIYGKHKDFKYVTAGATKLFMTGQENQTLFDIEWTEADRGYVQEITMYYRPEDLQVTFVGGVFMGEEQDIYNKNPFSHRRMVPHEGEWVSAPIYPFAKSGFEPLDVTGRFAYYKSAAFKAYWDDASINKAYQLLQDGMYLDVMKPTFISGAAKVDGTVIAPGAVVPLPKDAAVTPYSLGSNLAAAMNVLMTNKEDLAESTQDQTQGGIPQPGVTLGATQIAERNAKLILGVFGLMIANLVEQLGALTQDCIIQHATLGELDTKVPEALKVRYRTYLAKGEEKGKNISSRIIFDGDMMGRQMTEDEKEEAEWNMYTSSGKTAKEREESDQRVYRVNPYQFARMTYSTFVDADQIVSRSMGTDQQRKMMAFQMFSNPIVQPYINMSNVVQDFVIEPFSDGDPEKYMRQESEMNNLNAMMGAVAPQVGTPQPSGAVPSAQTALQA